MVGHGVRTDGVGGVAHLQVKQSHRLPVAAEGLVHVNVGVADHTARNVDLHIAAGAEVHALPFRKLQDQLLDECGHIVVGNYGAGPLLDAEELFGYLDGHVFTHFHLAEEPVVVGGHLARNVSQFGGQYLAASGEHFPLAGAARAAPAACGRDKHLLVGQCLQQRATALVLTLLLLVNGNLDLPFGDQSLAHIEQQSHQHPDDGQKDDNCRKGCPKYHVRVLLDS